MCDVDSVFSQFNYLLGLMYHTIRVMHWCKPDQTIWFDDDEIIMQTDEIPHSSKRTANLLSYDWTCTKSPWNSRTIRPTAACMHARAAILFHPAVYFETDVVGHSRSNYRRLLRSTLWGNIILPHNIDGKNCKQIFVYKQTSFN